MEMRNDFFYLWLGVFALTMIPLWWGQSIHEDRNGWLSKVRYMSNDVENARYFRQEHQICLCRDIASIGFSALFLPAIPAFLYSKLGIAANISLICGFLAFLLVAIYFGRSAWKHIVALRS